MADYAGACAAIRQRFEDNWISGGVPLTSVKFVNDTVGNGLPIQNAAGEPIPWVFFEIVHSGSYIIGSGTPGQQTIVYDVLIKAHVFVPVNSGVTDAFPKAVAIGEMFRNKVFYDTITPGCYVRSGYEKDGQPRIDEGDASSDDGQWFAVTATVPAQYWHMG
jgi:hypothetical protein